ncbi:MAG: hypothetical protein E7514_05370 [Ruminococcaceae bacterium]|nr:hypothetical protein [Oscillospiraceae bacterium]
MHNDNSINELFNKVRNASSKEELQKELTSKLTEEQNKKLKSILSDDGKIKKLLNSPKAQEILKKFREE